MDKVGANEVNLEQEHTTESDSEPVSLGMKFKDASLLVFWSSCMIIPLSELNRFRHGCHVRPSFKALSSAARFSQIIGEEAEKFIQIVSEEAEKFIQIIGKEAAKHI